MNQNKTKYKIICKIGNGAYGTVFKAIQNEKIVAIKQITLKSKSQMDVLREISTLSNCNHKNIIRLIDYKFSSDSGTLIMEYLESNLRLVIDDVLRPLNNCILKYFFVQIFYGVAYLHNLGIMHRDLKPENILINLKNQIKIADFGLACLYFKNDKNRSYSHQVATRWYRAPELLFGSTKYNPKIDIWSIGCILAEFLNATPLFLGLSDIEQINCVFKILGTPITTSWPEWNQLPDSGKVKFDIIEPVNDWSTIISCNSAGSNDEERLNCLNILKQMLKLNINERPTAIECLESLYFNCNIPQSLNFYQPPVFNYKSEIEKLKSTNVQKFNKKRTI